jgi:hypothetical protein
MKKKITILALLFFCFWQLHAQASHGKGQWSMEGNVFLGRILKPDDFVKNILRNTPVRLYDLKVGYTETGNSILASDYNHPGLGFGISVADFSDVSLWKAPHLGNIYTLYGFFDRTLVRYKRLSINYMLSSGLTYNPDIYDQETNTQKVFSSIPVMLYIGFGAGLKYRLADRWEIGLSADAKHYSNGRMGIMNKGLNIAGGSFSLQYAFSPYREYPPRIDMAFKKHVYYHFMAGGGMQTYLEDWMSYWKSGRVNLERFEEKQYAKFFASPDVMYRFSRKYGCGIGLDLFYIPSTASFREWDQLRNEEVAAGSKYSSWSLGVAFNQEIYFHNLAITASLGCYLYRELGMRDDEGPIYQRFGIRYYVPKTNDLFFGFAIKAHQFKKAEYFELSLGKKWIR